MTDETLTDDVLPAFRIAFATMREELSFAASYEELEEVFFFEDHLLQQGFVSPRLARQLSRRIVDLYWSWAGYLHRLLMPNPHHMLEVTEAGFLSEEQQQEVIDLLSKIMKVVSGNNVLGVTQDAQEQAAFFDDALALWREIAPSCERITRHVTAQWMEKITPSRP